MQYSLLIEMPGETLVVNMPADVQYQIYLLDTVWPAEITPGTSVVGLNKLIHCVISTEAADPLAMVQALWATYSLPWTVEGMQTFDGSTVLVPVNMATVAQYIQPRYSDEAQTIEIPKDVSWIHQFAGQGAWQ